MVNENAVGPAAAAANQARENARRAREAANIARQVSDKANGIERKPFQDRGFAGGTPAGSRRRLPWFRW